LGFTALVAYSMGRQSAPVSDAPMRAATTAPSGFSKPVAFISPAVQPQEPIAAPRPPGGQVQPAKVSLPEKPDVPAAPSSGQVPSPRTNSVQKPASPDTNRKLESGMTAAAIAAAIVQASRAEYHAGGRPCACPDDRARNGSSCGGRSAYSRPGGAAPLCYLSDVTAAMIESYRQRQASR
jgi:hypothetical protein